MAQGMPCQIEGIVSILVTPHRTVKSFSREFRYNDGNY